MVQFSLIFAERLEWKLLKTWSYFRTVCLCNSCAQKHWNFGAFFEVIWNAIGSETAVFQTPPKQSINSFKRLLQVFLRVMLKWTYLIWLTDLSLGNQHYHAASIRKLHSWTNGFCKIVGFAGKRFLSSLPLPPPTDFCSRPKFRTFKKRKMLHTCGNPYGNAGYAGYTSVRPSSQTLLEGEGSPKTTRRG